MRGLRTRLTNDDRGMSFIEILVGSAISMIGFAVIATVLTTTQKQQRGQDLVSEAVSAARVAATRLADEVRGARWIEASGGDAIAWLDANRDGIRTAAENVTFRVETVGGVTRLVRIQDSATTLLATGLGSGSLTVTPTANAAELSVTLALPGADGHDGATVTTKVSTRGNG